MTLSTQRKNVKSTFWADSPTRWNFDTEWTLFKIDVNQFINCDELFTPRHKGLHLPAHKAVIKQYASKSMEWYKRRLTPCCSRWLPRVSEDLQGKSDARNILNLFSRYLKTFVETRSSLNIEQTSGYRMYTLNCSFAWLHKNTWHNWD